MIQADQNMQQFMRQSLLSADLRREINGYDLEKQKVQDIVVKKQELLHLGRTPPDVLKTYKDALDKLPHTANSARKKIRQEMNSMEVTHKFLLTDLLKYDSLETVKGQLTQLSKNKHDTETYVETNLKTLIDILVVNEFILSHLILTEKGRVAAKLQEVHPLAMADLFYKTDQFASLSSAELASLFSCFYPLNVSEEVKVHNPPDNTVYKTLLADLQKYQTQEEKGYLNTGSPYDLSYDLLEYVLKWCQSSTEQECKIIIQEVKEYTGTFLGEFIKALLKVNAIATEFEHVCELTQNMALLEKIRAIPSLTLKYVATNQSLYL